MKKSLLFVAAMFAAVSVNAQKWMSVTEGSEEGAVVAAGATETAVGEFTGLTVKLAGATDWTVKNLPSTTWTGADGTEWNNAYVQGGTNGVGSINEDGSIKTAPSLIKDGSISSHIQLTATTAGTAYVAAKFGKNKGIWCAKVADAELEDLDYADVSAYLYTYQGLYIKDDATYGGLVAAEADQYATLPVAVEPGFTYFFFVSGSKIMLCGINFVAGASGIETVKAAKNVEGVAYNLAGQKVSNSFKGIVIKNGVKMIQK